MAVLELCTRGTPQMYYGEELGMRTTDPARIEDVHDPIGKLGWPKEKGRDGERTPMQWDATRATPGFTTVTKPWLPIPPSVNELQRRDREQGSRFDFQHVQEAARSAQNEPALRDGAQIGHRQTTIRMSSPSCGPPGTQTVVGGAEHERQAAEHLSLDWKSSWQFTQRTLDCLYAVATLRSWTEVKTIELRALRRAWLRRSRAVDSPDLASRVRLFTPPQPRRMC